jgi:CTD small phosphatase-like protein 2
LENILIIDNNIYSFAFNLENGIPIINFMGDKNDNELIKVMKYLFYIKDFKNLMEENEKTYNLKKIFNSNI